MISPTDVLFLEVDAGDKNLILEWARAVEKSIHPQLVASEQKVIDTMK